MNDDRYFFDFNLENKVDEDTLVPYNKITVEFEMGVEYVPDYIALHGLDSFKEMMGRIFANELYEALFNKFRNKMS